MDPDDVAAGWTEWPTLWDVARHEMWIASRIAVDALATGLAFFGIVFGT